MQEASFKELLIYFLITGICGILLYELFFLIKKKLEMKVKQISIKYKMLIEINCKYHFWVDVEEKYIFEKRLKSKQQFERFNYNKFFEEKIEKNIESVEEIIRKTKENQINLEQYKREIENISLSTTKEESKKSRIPYYLFEIIEEDIFCREQITAVVNPVFICVASYTSPQGRNHYENETAYSLQQLISHHSIVQDRIKERETKDCQRKLMTDSLRYNILKRDGFKCVLCGRSTQDGIKLHVDHIMPISKGGRTEPNNLRTLCSECNWGKSDKYDELGEN